jgi:hypothetical protein
MGSPFPGMDPYLEDPTVWEEFHHVLITECMYFVGDRLPSNYQAKIQERVELISRDDEAAAQYVPDVAVITRPREGLADAAQSSGGEAAVGLAPVIIPSTESIEVREGYIEIIRLPDHQLITSIELLSPWNKFGEGVGEYRHKRRSRVRHGVHVVEIDLLRRGHQTELARPLPRGDYYAFVFRANRRPDVDVYAWSLHDPLPIVEVPLAPPDADLRLELSTVVNTAYDRGRYQGKLRYSEPPPQPISQVDAAWATEVARQTRAGG